MKPITNILLIVALICYTFLAFYNVALMPEPLTGLKYTAGNITANFSLIKTLFVLVPYVAGFAAITFNCLKNRWWGIAATLCILAMIAFFARTGNYHDMRLLHEPEVVPSVALGEGFPIEGLGSGYYLSFVFTILALLSAIISMMPFKFNESLERLIDNQVEHGFEEGRKHITNLGSKVKGEWDEIENRTRQRKRKPSSPDDHNNTPAQPIADSTEPNATATAGPDHSAYMPGGSDSEPSTSDGQPDYSAYMPKDSGSEQEDGDNTTT